MPTQWKFKDYIKSWTYHTGTSLMSTSTDIDNTVSTYSWDKLMRFQNITDCIGVSSDMEYSYGTGDSLNNIMISTLYPLLGNQTNITLRNLSFFNGIGLKIQSLAYQQDPSNPSYSIGAEIEYDDMGTPHFTYEPISCNPQLKQYITVANDYSTRTNFDQSPLNRPSSISPPAWYRTLTNFGSNTVSDSVYNHAASQYYPIASLFKHITTDPDSQDTEIFTDKRGRTILSRIKARPYSTSPNDKADTYTLFDDKDRPYLVLPPQTTTTDNNLIFKTLYSGDDQVISQDNPDQEPITMVYNERDQLTHRQDGNMKADNRWYAYTYDEYGHVLTEGWATDSLSPPTDTLIQNTWGTTGVEKGKLKTEAIKLLNDPNNLTIQKEHNYDDCGRPIVTKSNSILHPVPGSIIDSMILDSRGVVIESYQIIIPDGITIRKRHTFDHAGRQKKTYIQITTPEQTWPEQELSEKSYTVKEQLSALKLGGTLQEVNYGYLPNRFLSSINTSYTSFNNSNDLFGMNIQYDTEIDPNNIDGETLLKDGNISGIQWSYKQPNGTVERKHAYGYQYDFLKRLTFATNSQNYSLNNHYTTTYSYADHRGNFSSITRKSAGSMIDNLNYNYYPGTNKIKAISDGSSVPFQKKGYKANTVSDFTYDANGAMDYDAGRGVDIQVNHLDLPNKIIVPDSNGMIMYYYSADGQLQRQEEIRDSVVYKIRDYIGAVEYVNGAIDQIRHEDGYITLDKGLSTEHLQLSGIETADQVYESLSTISERTIPDPRNTTYKAEQFIVLTPGFQVDTGAIFSAQIDTFPVLGLDYRYFINDHLGNVRVEFKDNGSGTAVTVSNHNYYPFGMRWEDSSSDTKNNYFYNGKELQKSFDLDYLNYGARFYDPAISRFLSVDPMSKLYASHSPYNYVENNPIRFIDPDGRMAVDAMGPDDWVQRANGEIYWDVNATSQSTTQAGETYLGYGFATVSSSGLQTNYNSNATFDHYSTNDNVLPEVTVLGSDGIGGKDVAAVSSDGVGGLGAGMQSQGGSMRLTNGAANGGVLSLKYYESGWTGGSRARITTYQLGTAGKFVGRVGTAGTLTVGAYDIGVSAYHEGGFGTYTQRATGRFAGSLAGGAAGAAIGANFFGIGAIPGGIIGGLVGGYGGSKAGEQLVKEIQDR